MTKFILALILFMLIASTAFLRGAQTAGEIITESIYRVQNFQPDNAYASTNANAGTIGATSVHGHIDYLRKTTANNCKQGQWLLDDATEKYSLSLVDIEINDFLTNRIQQICQN